MIIDIKKALKAFSIIVLPWLTLAMLLIVTGQILRSSSSPYVIGAFIHTPKEDSSSSVSSSLKKESNDLERFQRPSKQSGLPLKYTFREAKNPPPYIPEGYPKLYDSPTDLIHAYYSILKDASNMINYTGTCGTVGDADIPYPYAYTLLSQNTKQKVSLEEFKKSFTGIGHMTLLKLHPAYHSSKTPENIQSYMVEIEVITGKPLKDPSSQEENISYFAYYYGLITTEHSTSEGWKITSIHYIPEDFLCAPYHLWDWHSEAFVQIVYGDWYKLIDRIDHINIKDSYVSIYASNKENQYRFDFVRLVNGKDVLLHEYIRIDKKWKSVHLLKPDHQMYKLSLERFDK